MRYVLSISRDIDALIRDETLQPWQPEEEDWVTPDDEEAETILSEQYEVPDRPRLTVKEAPTLPHPNLKC